MEVRRRAYRLLFPEGRPFAQLESADGERLSALFLGSSLHTAGGLDETYAFSEPVGDGTRIVVEAKSSVWRSKRLILECRDEVLEAWVEVEGEGALTDCHLFGGYYSGQLRWGSGLFQSGSQHVEVWNPEPWQSERRALPPAESTTIDVLGTSLPGKGHWFFTPAPFCYALRGRVGTWTMVGLGAPLEAQTFTEFHYDATESAFSLRLAYEGQTRVDGSFRTPSVLFTFGASDPYVGLERYVAALRESGFLDASRIGGGERPGWWSEPIFCGWGAQCSLANVAAKQGEQVAGAPAYARQGHYDRFVETLVSNGLTPGTVVLDDKWQRDYGTNEVDPEKWPDLPGWIARRHTAGQRVLLWWKAWDPEGLPPEQCVRNGAGTIVAADPSNPAYEATLRASVRRMLGPRSEGGYDADGFKVDFSARTPSGPGLMRHGTAWGVSLLHKLLWILYDETKRVKPDALVMTHTPNPHFADVTDMIRLNDVNTGADVVSQMRHRAAVARAACPDSLIDTDNWPMPSKAVWREYVRLQPEIGVPSLYFVTQVDSGEPLEEEDYAAVRACWEEWRRRRGRE